MISALKPNSVWPLAISSLGGFAGVLSGIAYRSAHGISEAHKHIRGVIPDNVCANNFSVMPLNTVNSLMQFVATNPVGWLLRAAVPVGLCVAAYKSRDTEHGGFLGKMSATMLVVSSLWVAIQNPLRDMSGITDDPSGHIIMMSAVGLSLGLADQCVRAYQEKTWTKLQVASSVLAVGFGLANAVFLFNTAACFHTVAESFQGMTIISALTAVTLNWAFSRR